MKHCGKCNTSKSLTGFSKRGTGHQPWCKLCTSERNKLTYKTRPQRRLDLKESTAKYRQQAEQYIMDYLKTHPCPCGESNPLTLQFDHIGDKTVEICHALIRGFALDKIKDEITKCQVLCANCHSIKTASQVNSWKLKWLARSDSN